jgi:hypothetical protein
MTKIHTVPTGTMGAALLSSGIASQLAFDFDLVQKIADLKHTELRNRVMSRLAFACDAYINIAIQRAMTTLRADQELAGTARWDNYQAFLHYVAGIAASEETLTEAGMLVQPLRDTVQKLFNVRTQIHDILSENIGASYAVPLITDWMRNPRVRRDDASTLVKIKASARFAATNDDGAVDVDLERQLLESIGMKRSVQKEDQLKWDKQRGELSATMFDALKIRDDISDVGFAGDNEEPFLELDPVLQHKLLTGSVRYIQDVVAVDLTSDRKITAEEHAAAAIESRPLIKAIRQALEHRRFSDIEV